MLLYCLSVEVNRPLSAFVVKGFFCVNDSSVSRTTRLKKVLHSYVPKQLLTDEKLRITSFDGTKWGEVERNTFDKVSQCHGIMFIFFWNSSDRMSVPEFMMSLPRLCSHLPFFCEFRSLLTSPALQTDIRSWKTTTTYSVSSGPVRGESCHSYRRSCCCKFWWNYGDIKFDKAVKWSIIKWEVNMIIDIK